jgi:hypothetical protein
VAGVLHRDVLGTARIGGLELRNAPDELLGRRAIFEGRLTQGVLHVERASLEAKLLASLAPRLLIEAYVRRFGDGLALGSGLRVEAPAGVIEGLTASEQRSIVALDLTADRDFVVESLTPHAAPRRSGSGSNGPAGPGIGEGVAQGPGGPPGPGLGGPPGPGPGFGHGFGRGSGGMQGGHR